MSTTLDAIVKKFERAKKHFDDLDRAIQEFRAGEPYGFIEQDDPNAPDRVNVALKFRTPLPSSDFAVLVGDFVHNVRSALDYLACGLVQEVGKAEVTPSTAFPIWRRPEKPTADQLKTLVYGKVKGAPLVIKEKLLLLEPYQGGNHERLWILDYLDLVDKHRLLIIAGSAPTSLHPNMGAVGRKLAETLPGNLKNEIPDIWITLNLADRMFPLKDGDIVYSYPRDSVDDSNPHLAIAEAFGEPEVIKGKSLLPTLIKLYDATAEIIQLFAGEFA